MARAKRADESGHCYQALSRGRARRQILHKTADYEDYLQCLGETVGHYPVDLMAFCLIPNHGHLVLKPNMDHAMGNSLDD